MMLTIYRTRDFSTIGLLLLLAGCGEAWHRGEIISAVSAVATILYLFATIGILFAMLRANAIAAKASEESATSTRDALAETRQSNAITERSVAVAEATLQFTRETFHVTNRPRLHVTKVKTLKGTEPGDAGVRVGIIITNLGNVAAHEVAVGHAFHILRPGEPELDVSTLPVPNPRLAMSAGSVGPGAPINLTPVYSFGSASQTEILDGAVRLMIGCVVHYKDDLSTVYLYRFAYQFKLGENWRVYRELHELASPPLPAV